jgi:hypothetical protein
MEPYRPPGWNQRDVEMPLFLPVGIAPQENWGSWNQRPNGDPKMSTGVIEGKFVDLLLFRIPVGN